MKMWDGSNCCECEKDLTGELLVTSKWSEQEQMVKHICFQCQGESTEDKRNHFREIIKTTGSLPTFHVHELLNALDAADREAERLQEENLSLKLAVDIEQYVKQIKSLNEENQRLRKALEEIAKLEDIYEVVAKIKAVNIARQALEK
jgi:uncharacterized tellurite resistance protein B-like protein